MITFNLIPKNSQDSLRRISRLISNTFQEISRRFLVQGTCKAREITMGNFRTRVAASMPPYACVWQARYALYSRLWALRKQDFGVVKRFLKTAS